MKKCFMKKQDKSLIPITCPVFYVVQPRLSRYFTTSHPFYRALQKLFWRWSSVRKRDHTKMASFFNSARLLFCGTARPSVVCHTNIAEGNTLKIIVQSNSCSIVIICVCIVSTVFVVVVQHNTLELISCYVGV